MVRVLYLAVETTVQLMGLVYVYTEKATRTEQMRRRYMRHTVRIIYIRIRRRHNNHERRGVQICRFYAKSGEKHPALALVSGARMRIKGART